MSRQTSDSDLADAVSTPGALHEGDHLGVGVFETFLAHRTPEASKIAITCFERHWQRLAAGCSRIGCAAPGPDECLAAIHTSCRSTVRSDAQAPQRVRIVVKPSGWTVTSESFTAIDKSISHSVISVLAERSVPEFKSCSSLVSVLARRQAAEHGAAEAILVDRLGIAREGAWSNFFWRARDGVWRTPEHSILPGVTRSILCEMLSAENQLLFCDAPWSTICEDATGFFLTQSTNGVLPISSLDHRVIDSAEATRICARADLEFVRLRAEYESTM